MVSKGREMKIACSWCRKEGKQGILGEKAPLDDVRETHGICGNHCCEVQALWQTSRLVTAGSKASHDAWHVTHDVPLGGDTQSQLKD
jgi:hypothetical protein